MAVSGDRQPAESWDPAILRASGHPAAAGRVAPVLGDPGGFGASLGQRLGFWIHPSLPRVPATSLGINTHSLLPTRWRQPHSQEEGPREC